VRLSGFERIIVLAASLAELLRPHLFSSHCPIFRAELGAISLFRNVYGRMSFLGCNVWPDVTLLRLGSENNGKDMYLSFEGFPVRATCKKRGK